MLIASLTTEHKLGLGLIALAFIVFALVCSLVIPHFRPDFPSRQGMKLFLGATVALFVAMLLAIEVFGVEKPEAEAAGPETTQTAPTTTTTGGGEPSAADVARGKELYTSLGCLGCHSLDGAPGVGPTWQGLYGSQVTLTNGQHLVADDAYLAKAITDPDADIVEGYKPGQMSGTIQKGQVSPEDAAALVAYIQSLK